MGLRISVLTLFPELIENYIASGIVGRAVKSGLAHVDAVNVRDFAHDKHRTVDDLPFGGGAGMVMKAEPLALAMESLPNAGHRVLLTPSGRRFSQEHAVAWSTKESLTFVCGRYEGIDERFCQGFIDEELSIGDYVLTGGELGALVMIDATLRHVSGVLGNHESLANESFADGLVEHAHYTRPAEWRGQRVPDVLLSGHHEAIKTWRQENSEQRTRLRRPDLLEHAGKSAE